MLNPGRGQVVSTGRGTSAILPRGRTGGAASFAPWAAPRRAGGSHRSPPVAAPNPARTTGTGPAGARGDRIRSRPSRARSCARASPESTGADPADRPRRGRLRPGDLGVHARRAGVPDRLRPRRPPGRRRCPHLRVRGGDGPRRTPDGGGRPPPPGPDLAHRVPVGVRRRARHRGGRVDVLAARRDPGARGVRQRRFPRGRPRRRGPLGACGSDRAGDRHPAGRYEPRPDRRRSGRRRRRGGARLAGHLLGGRPLRRELAVLAGRPVVVMLVVGALVNGGTFAAYTYLARC